jgi:hypothetical protein
MVIQDQSLAWNHWIVVTGFRIEPPLTFELKIMDPGNSSRRYVPGESVWDAAKAVPGVWHRVYRHGAWKGLKLPARRIW